MWRGTGQGRWHCPSQPTAVRPTACSCPHPEVSTAVPTHGGAHRLPGQSACRGKKCWEQRSEHTGAAKHRSGGGGVPVGQKRKVGGRPSSRYASLATEACACAREGKTSLSARHMQGSMSSKSSAKALHPRAATCRHSTGARRAAAGGCGEPGELQAGTTEHCSTPTDDAHIAMIPGRLGLLPLCSSCRAACRHCGTPSPRLCCPEQTVGPHEAPRAALGSGGAHSSTEMFGVGMGLHMSTCAPC